MFVALVFWLLLVSAAVIGRQVGDREDRKAILAIVLAAVATAAVQILAGGPQAPVFVTAIDIALLIAIVRFALRSRRYWPLWFAGLHGAGVAFRLAALAVPTGWRALLEMVSAFWALPAVIAMVAGLLLDRRGGLFTEDTRNSG